MKDYKGNTIGMSNSNPILVTRLYKVEYEDGYIQLLAANVVADNLLNQVK